MSYQMTYFRIHADGYMPGWSNQSASDQFDAECRVLFSVAPVAMQIAERFSVRRVCDKENHSNLANRFVGDVVTRLLEQGLLVAATTRQGEGI